MRKFVALVVAAALCVLGVVEPLVAKTGPQSQDAVAIKAQVRALRQSGAKAEVALPDGTRLRGRIIRVDDDSFTMREEKSRVEVAWRYAQVIEVRKKGLSRRERAALTGALIGGSVLFVLCVAPFPLGFLCQQDPS
jgi:hypothetical protein